MVPLSGSRFLVADDEHGVRLVMKKGGQAVATLILDAAGNERVSGLEGMCRVGDRVLAVREADGALTSFVVPAVLPAVVPAVLPAVVPAVVPAAGASIGLAKEVGFLPRPPTSQGKPNKGWEGIAFLPASLAFDQRDHLVAVHEGKPRLVGVFSWPSLSPERHIDIGPPLDALLADLSDVAVHPRTGELWILSDESEAVARVQLTKAGLTFVAAHTVPVGDGEKPEGIAFDEAGALWLVTDNSSRLLRLE